MSFRIEKKFYFNKKNSFNFYNWLKKEKIEKIFPDRLITSIYLDNKYGQMYLDSEEGCVPRKKIRLRYYNNDITNCLFEIKSSLSNGRYKITKKKELLKSKSHYFDKQYGDCSPALQVSYNRSYFSYKNIRVTYDQNISYKKIVFNDLISLKYFRDENNVVELKNNYLQNEDYIRSNVPFQFLRFSKYCRGYQKIKGLVK